MIPPEKCQILKKIWCLQKNGKKSPKCLLCKLAQEPESEIPLCTNVAIVGPYLKLITEVLYPKGGQPLVSDFSLNIQYYNQGNYYSTYEHLFSDLVGGPYSMPQASSVNAIQTYFKNVYGEVPQMVSDSIVVGKLLTPAAGVSSYVEPGTLAQWMQTAQSSNIPSGGYMWWSAGFFNDKFPSNKLVTETFKDVNAKHKVMYIGAGDTGQVWLADGSEKVYAQGSDPDGSNALKVLKSYAEAGFNELLLAFWNKTTNSDWVIDWASINKDSQKNVISQLRAVNPEVKVLVSAGGAYGLVGPQAGDPVEWATALVNFTKDNNLDGIDLDLEGGLLGTQWSQEQYDWVKSVVETIGQLDSSLMLSFAPVGPLCAVPSS
jgi:chitinase